MLIGIIYKYCPFAHFISHSLKMHSIVSYQIELPLVDLYPW